MAKQKRDQQAADTAVAIEKRVNCFELKVSERRFHQRRSIGVQKLSELRTPPMSSSAGTGGRDAGRNARTSSLPAIDSTYCPMSDRFTVAPLLKSG